MTTPAEDPKGVIFQQGYRHYEDRYLGRLHAVASLAWADIKRSLGIKRGIWYRVGFFILMGIILVVGITAFFINTLSEQMPTDSQSSGFTPFANPYSYFYDSLKGIIFWLLCALIIPDLLCNDRRHGTLRLYLARPINLSDYLLAKGLAIVALLGGALLVPQLLLFLAKTLSAGQPAAYFSSHLGDLGALLATGLIFAFYYALISGALSSLTRSTGYAAGGIIGLFLATNLIAEAIFLFTKHRPATLIDLSNLIGRVKDALFGIQQPLIALNITLQSRSEPLHPATLPPYPVEIYVVAVLAIALLSMLIILWRYRRETTA